MRSMPPDATGRRVTSYDVAQSAGVSQPTVSRCFRLDSNISPATRSRVLEVAERLGYTPNALARSLITRRSDLIAVIATRYTLRGNPDVAYAIGESLRAAGKQLMLITVERDYPAKEKLRPTLEYPLDGIISCALIDDAQLTELRERQIAVVLFNRAADQVQVDHVTTNHSLAARQIAGLLVRAGHRRILCVAGPAAAWVSQQRVEGFQRGLQDFGVPPLPPLETDFSYQGGRDAFLAHVAGGERPEAVFCANDQLAFGVMDACRFQLGWQVPEQVSVIGFDDVAEAERPCYGLTTMQQQSAAMAQTVVRLLLARLENRNGEPVRTIIESTFMRRSSARLDPT